MATCSENITIHSDLNKTYKVAEKYPEFIEFYNVKEIIFSDDVYQKVKIKSVFCGVVFSWEGTGTKERLKKISWIQSKGLLRGMKVDWLFSIFQESFTRVTLKVSYETGIPFWDCLALNIFVRKTLPKVLTCLKVACEHPNLNL